MHLPTLKERITIATTAQLNSPPPKTAWSIVMRRHSVEIEEGTPELDSDEPLCSQTAQNRLGHTFIPTFTIILASGINFFSSLLTTSVSGKYLKNAPLSLCGTSDLNSTPAPFLNNNATPNSTSAAERACLNPLDASIASTIGTLISIAPATYSIWLVILCCNSRKKTLNQLKNLSKGIMGSNMVVSLFSFALGNLITRTIPLDDHEQTWYIGAITLIGNIVLTGILALLPASYNCCTRDEDQKTERTQRREQTPRGTTVIEVRPTNQEMLFHRRTSQEETQNGAAAAAPR